MPTLTCIGEPISWLRLERFAQTGADVSVRVHIDACDACRHCLDEIQRDVVALPVLHVPQKRRWWTFAMPALAAVAAVAALLFLLRPRDPVEEGVAYVKGIGEVIIDVVRERRGIVRDDVRTFSAGDRFKVVVTCPPTREVSLTVEIRERGAPEIDRPLAPARIVCGNRIMLPGAFTLSGDRPHELCVAVEARAKACLTLRPE